MIKDIRTKSVALLWFKRNPSKLPAKLAKKLRPVLTALNSVTTMAELKATIDPTGGANFQKFYERGFDDDWEIRVSGNWRLLFRFDGSDILAIELTDETH